MQKHMQKQAPKLAMEPDTVTRRVVAKNCPHVIIVCHVAGLCFTPHPDYRRSSFIKNTEKELKKK
jgi:hypothetical protein